MMIRKLVVAAAVAALPLGGLAACARAPYEDCEVSDQEAREPDCGYWTLNGVNRSGGQPGSDWVWVFFTWVNLGHDSSPPDDWDPPKGTNPPREDADGGHRKSTGKPAVGSTPARQTSLDQRKAKDTGDVAAVPKTKPKRR